MLAPSVSTRVHPERHAVVVSVSGPITTDDHVAELLGHVAAIPHSSGVVVDLSPVTAISQVAVEALRALILDRGRHGARIAVSCDAVEVRTYLVVADIDTLAPLLHTSEQALPLVTLAA